ncbi:MAG TPA: dihydropteroate synthase [Bacillota bacterium]|nr:dihydropteroate synthase [Bacillota bacterium]
MNIHTKTQCYDLNERTHIMGVLNVTPDSFSDGGKYASLDAAIARAVKMEADGADIIDVGGESTRPQHAPVSTDEEIERVVPIIEAVRKEVNIPISIDTYKARTADAALNAGADIINDVWGGLKDPDMAVVAKTHNVPIVLMHNRTDKNYTSLISDMKQDLQDRVENVLAAGVKKENIILDPGIGFAKTREDNYVVMNYLDKFHDLGYPILLGTSRKSFIEEVLPDLPPEQRDGATGATTCLGISKGIQLVRVHNVSYTKQLVLMMDKMLSSHDGRDRQACWSKHQSWEVKNDG